jgi:hypothetical protein
MPFFCIKQEFALNANEMFNTKHFSASLSSNYITKLRHEWTAIDKASSGAVSP